MLPRYLSQGKYARTYIILNDLRDSKRRATYLCVERSCKHPKGSPCGNVQLANIQTFETYGNIAIYRTPNQLLHRTLSCPSLDPAHTFAGGEDYLPVVPSYHVDGVTTRRGDLLQPVDKLIDITLEKRLLCNECSLTECMGKHAATFYQSRRWLT